MPADPRTLSVSCPHCGARYLLPSNLLGPGGARVRCPGCSRSFDVPAPERPTAGPIAPTGEPAAAPRATHVHPAESAPPAAPSMREAPQMQGRPSLVPRAAEPAPAVPPHRVAMELLSALTRAGGESMAAAALEGNLFAQHGPAIFDAFDEYRRRAPNGGPGPFRAVLRELFGVDLPEITPLGRGSERG